VFIAGAAVQWLRDGLKLFQSSAEIENLAKDCADSDGVFFIPALSGLGAPHWAPHAKGLIGGLTRRSTKAHLARACLEGIAHSVADTFGQLVKDSGGSLKKLRVDGGASLNQILLQAQADYLQVNVSRPRDIESTARGAASLAALTLGIMNSAKEIGAKNPAEILVQPKMKKAEAKDLRGIWIRRVKALMAGAF
jgi:glycerol kinase